MKFNGGLQVLGMLALVALGASVALADPPATPPVSKFAPIDDLATQIERYVKESDTAPANPAAAKPIMIAPRTPLRKNNRDSSNPSATR